ncbi:queuosine precursor transporter [Candidatus Aerophobetes bacterium]|nr:queuosine precursor transporter [Candidatus Aerophobetes bacterium]
MPNEILWFIFIIVDLSFSIFAFYIWGRYGLYVMVAMGTFVCNLQVIKTIQMFGMVATLGNVVYASIFFNTDILSEIYGKREARKAVWVGFYALISATVAMQFAIRFKPDVSDAIQSHLEAIFNLMPRVVIASLSAYLISQHHDVWAFHFWKRVTGGRWLWLRNNLSTMVSQLIDTTVFTFLAFWGVFSFPVFCQIFLTTYLFKWIIAVLDTPFLYLARWLYYKKKNFQLFSSKLLDKK